MSKLSDDIIKYKKGELSPKKMHALEKRALTDPFLAEALEGAENFSAESFEKDVADLNQRMLNRKKSILFTPLRIAAGVILISASVFVFYQLSPKHESIALNKEKVKTPAPAAKSEPAKPVEKKQEEKSEQKKNVVASKPIITESAKTHVPQSAGEVEKAADRTEQAGVSKAKMESQPSFAESQALAAPERKTEESKQVAREQAPVSIASEPSQEAKEDADLRKSARALSTAKKAKVSEAASGAALSKRDQIESRSISGKVISADDGSPLPGVNVVVEGTMQGTVTDSNGNFSLQTISENQRLVFSFIGLQTQEVDIQSKDKVDVELKSDASQLSEVVITSSGVRRDDDAEPIIHLANPAGGRRAYNKYLDANVRYPDDALKNNIKGKVRVEFSVLADGSLDSYKVVKSLGHGCDEEVIRLIKEGPKWSPTTENGRPIESKVRVGVKFDPAKAGR